MIIISDLRGYREIMISSCQLKKDTLLISFLKRNIKSVLITHKNDNIMHKF